MKKIKINWNFLNRVYYFLFSLYPPLPKFFFTYFLQTPSINFPTFPSFSQNYSTRFTIHPIFTTSFIQILTYYINNHHFFKLHSNTIHILSFSNISSKRLLSTSLHFHLSHKTTQLISSSIQYSLLPSYKSEPITLTTTIFLNFIQVLSTSYHFAHHLQHSIPLFKKNQIFSHLLHLFHLTLIT